VVAGRRAHALVALIALVGLSACAPQAAAPSVAASAAARHAQEDSVRAFMAQVAQAVSTEGPAAWGRQFADSPEFFMASDGALVFSDGEAAARGIEGLTQALPKIQLSFGPDLRVDVLSDQYAMVGTSYSEVQTDAQGTEHHDRGYLTALAELHEGHWRLRDAHWSSRP
jgi:hypothetical protein